MATLATAREAKRKVFNRSHAPHVAGDRRVDSIRAHTLERKSGFRTGVTCKLLRSSGPNFSSCGLEFMMVYLLTLHLSALDSLKLSLGRAREGLVRTEVYGE